MQSQPRIHDAAGGRPLEILGNPMLEKAASDDLSGGAAVFVTTVKPASGPLMHVHRDTDEFLYVLDGQLEVWIDGRHVSLTRGMSATLPRGVPHRFDNHGARAVTVLSVVTPGRGAKFFDDVDRERPRLPQDAGKLAAIVARHDIRFIG